ncbi:iron ABC transporter permease [Arcanobacterium wilhelmae]|nr:iron ABC transporter permease [Arcanobacterium wilhelmae]WFN91149.1 iron ABC transporter permease [Arcanobacterium wilhelmae]
MIDSRSRIRQEGPHAVWALLAIIPAAFLVLFFVIPVWDLSVLGFEQIAGAWGAGGIGALADLLVMANAGQALVTTLGLAFAGTVLSAIVGVPAAYILYCTAFPGRGLLRFLIVFPFVLPTIAVSMAFRSLYDAGGTFGSLGWEGSPVVIVLAMMFFNISVFVRTVGAAWGALNPNYEAAARTLGASPLRAFATVTWPRLRPALASASTLVFLYCATSYSLVMVLGTARTRTIETEIYRQTSEFLNLGAAAMLSILQVIVVIMALWVSRRAQRGQKAEAASRYVRAPRRLTRSQLPLLGVVVAVVALLIVAPLVQVLVRSLRRNGQWTLANFTDLTVPGAAKGIDAPVLASILESLQSAVLATVIAVALGLAVSLLVTRKFRRHAAAFEKVTAFYDALFVAPLGISSVTLGFGMLVALGGALRFLADSAFLVPLAQALVSIPIIVRTCVPMIGGVNRRLYDAAATLGANRFRAFWVVEGPVVTRALGVAGGFAFAISIGEFSATSFLVLQRDPTLPVMIYRLVSRAGAADQGMAYAGTVLLCVVTGLVMLGVERASAPARNQRKERA